MEEKAQTDGKPKTDKLAKLYKVYAALLEALKRKEEAKEFFQKAIDILRANGKEQDATFLEMYSQKMDQVQDQTYPQFSQQAQEEQ